MKDAMSWLLENFRNGEWTFLASRPKGPSPFHFFHVKARRRGRMTDGFGIHLNARTAFLKAACESVERHAIGLPGAPKTSNGIAIHSSKAEARRRARFELVERHLLLSHFWAGKPFYEPSFRVGRLPVFTSARDFLKQRGCLLHVWEMQKLGKLRSFVVVVADGRPRKRFGLFVGSATDLSARRAAESAIYEAFGHWTSFANGSLKPIGLGAYLRLERPDPVAHARLGAHPGYLRIAGDLFLTGRPRSENAPRRFNESSIPTKRITISSERGFPFHAYGASSETLLDIPWHHLSRPEKKEAVRKLNRFWLPKEPLRELSAIPHPFA